MKHAECNLGVSTADAENVHITFSDDCLSLGFCDWQDHPRTVVFCDVLAFRWQEFDEDGIRDDATYEVIDSPWLAQQAKLHAVKVQDYVHYRLCFNACGMLDVLARSAGCCGVG